MYDLLSGLTIIEVASFIAGPSCTLHLQQMGARVIRIEMTGGGPDFKRWPLAENGASLYWEGLNKGKESVALDLSSPDGRELATALITASGEERGLFVTNFPSSGFLSYENLARRRADLITVRVMGWPDGRNAVDYTVAAAIGVPYLTGEDGGAERRPVNSVIPTWDITTGALGAFALVAAERRRRMTGAGGEIRLALSDVAMGTLGHLGQLGETVLKGDRGSFGNALYGAFGRDFVTADGRRVMIVAITARQWTGLIQALAIEDAVAALETELATDFTADEGARFRYRDRLFPLAETAVARLSVAEIAERLNAKGGCWEPYRTVGEAIADDSRLVANNTLFASIEQASGYSYPVPGALARLLGEEAGTPVRAPHLGEHTGAVLGEILGLSDSEIASLHKSGVVGGGAGGA